MVVTKQDNDSDLMTLDDLGRIDMHRDPEHKKVTIDFIDFSGEACRMTLDFSLMDAMVSLHFQLKAEDKKLAIMPGQLSIEESSS
jgi:hypothetical protein